MSTVREISIEGYRSIAAIKELELRSINVLIGANGSGKSNILGAFKLLQTAIVHSSGLTEYVARSGGADRLLHFGSKVTQGIVFSVRFPDENGNFIAGMRHAADDTFHASYEIAKSELPADFMANLEIQPGLAPLVEFVRERVSQWRFYHFHDTGATSPMKMTADVHDNRRLRANGANLAAFLFLLREKHPSTYAQIQQTVRLAAPFFDDFALQPTELNEEKILLEWRHRGSDAYFNASSLSDGSLRFIALATLLLQPESLRPSVILLDEPELGLHPYAITLLASLLKQASNASQIMLATQSPLLLDHFEPEDVLVAERLEGATQVRRLESGKLKAWLEDYSLGQLWEKNEFGGRPARENADPDSAQ